MFTFDYSYWSHDGFDVDDEGVSIPSAGSNYASQRMVFNDLGQGVLNNAFEGNYKTVLAVNLSTRLKDFSFCRSEIIMTMKNLKIVHKTFNNNRFFV